MAGDGKTEQPTPRRRQKAREEGQIARSRELSGSIALIGSVLVLSWSLPSMLGAWRDFTRVTWLYAATHDLTVSTPLLMWTAEMSIRWAILPLVAAWLLATVVSLAQGGLVFAPASLTPRLDHLSPVSKMKQLFSITAVSELLKSLVPAVAIVYIAVQVLGREWPATALIPSGINGFATHLAATSFEIAWKSSLVLLAWSGFDYLIVRFKHEDGLKMSREELREEYKQTEGNPQIKARIRRLQRSTRRSRMLKDVERATVVVVNPTHFAVALEYGPNLPAPVVLAKGRDHLAEQIKQTARWHGIPILENPPLAQALYRTVEVGQSIPAKLYAAVAEILAFVYRMQARAAERRSN